MPHPSIKDWHQLSPAEVLDNYPALTIGQIAYVIGAVNRKGELDRRRVVSYIRDGRLRLIDDDPNLSSTRWTCSQATVRAFLSGDSRKAS